MNTTCGKFVVLEHTGYGPTHYDLLLERVDDLESWQFECFPQHDAVAKHIFAHRKIYLEYQGPLSSGRGSVKRVDEGTFWAEFCDDSWEIDFKTGRLAGRYVLNRHADGWRMESIKSACK